MLLVVNSSEMYNATGDCWYVCMSVCYLLLVTFPGYVALFNLPLSEEIAEVSENGEDSVAHVRQDGNQQRGLLKGLHKWLVVQCSVAGHMMALDRRTQTWTPMDT